MDPSCSDLEFFDFKNVTEDEIKEIRAILKGPGSNGCVELPWEIPIKENVIEDFSQDAGADDKAEPVVTSNSPASIETVVCQEPLVSTPQTPLVARLPPPPVEAFVAPPPTTMGPYANTPYFVSRTLPYLRAYTHMGVPFFAACPLSGAAGETNPYSHFVPVVPAAAGQEGEKNRQFGRRNKKKPSADGCGAECADEQTPVSPPVSSSSVPLVPLPPAAFGGTLPLHGYPPGLLPNYGPQGPSAAMYYVPVFNHYGGYLPSPPSAPMVLPLQAEVEVTKTLDPDNTAEHAAETTVDPDAALDHPAETTGEQVAEDADGGRVSVSPVAKNTEEVTDCNSSSSDLLSKSASSSPDVVTISEDDVGRDRQDIGRDSSRCWADLFKKPCAEVNGIDRQFPADRGRHGNVDKHGADIANGKLHSVPANSNVL